MLPFSGTWIEYLLVAGAAVVGVLYFWETILSAIRAKLPPPDYAARAAELRRRYRERHGEDGAV